MRSLAVIADDLGPSAVTDAVLDAYEATRQGRGILSGASMLANDPDSAATADRVRRAGMPVRLHINLTEGKPVSDPVSVRSLLSEDGCFLGKMGMRQRLHAGGIDPEEALHETQAQLALLRSWGLHISAADGHQHVHVLPGIAEKLAPLLASMGIRHVRIPDAPTAAAVDLPPAAAAFIHSVQGHARNARTTYAAEGLRSCDAFFGLRRVIERTRETLENMLLTLPAEGTSEWMVHPGRPRPHSEPFYASMQREQEWHDLTDGAAARIRARLDTMGVQLVFPGAE